MSTVYNPEADAIAEIERLERDARDLRRRIEHARGETDKRVLSRQLTDIDDRIKYLRARLP